MLSVTAAAAEPLELPDMGSSADGAISPHEQREMGERFYQQLRQRAPLVQDPLINDYLETLSYRLVSYSSEPGRRYKFFAIFDRNVNAFAAPGGFIGVHSGLLYATQSESELAAVLAHEIAHITQGHMARAFEQAKNVGIPMLLAMLGIAIAGGGGEATEAAVIGGQALMQQMQINMTRANEKEADRLGIHTLAQAGFDPHAMADAFARLQRSHRLMSEGPPTALRTHPVTPDRIAEAKARAAEMEVKSTRDPRPFYLMRARMRVLEADNPAKIHQHFEQTLAAGNYLDEPAARYGYALTLIRTGEPDRAHDILSKLVDNDGPRLAYELALGEAEHELGKTEQALARYDRLMALRPGNHPTAMAYGELLLNTGHAEKAERVLQNHLWQYRRDPELYDLYARAANAAGKTVRAREARAFAEHLRGNTMLAIRQLLELKRTADLDYYQRSRITARVAELQELLPEKHRRRAETRNRSAQAGLR